MKTTFFSRTVGWALAGTVILVVYGAQAPQAKAWNGAVPQLQAFFETGKQVAPFAIQVDRVESDVDALPAEFSDAIYENLIDEVTKTNKFQKVFRSGDHQADNLPNLLVLNTRVEKFQQGSETTRAVTTVGGATKLYVRMQVSGKDGKVLVDQKVAGNIRWFGENLKATHNLARGMAKILTQTKFSN